MHFQILIFDGFDELDALAPFEILHHAKAAGASVELVSVDGTSEITANHGLHFRPATRLDVQQPPDVLIVPGGGWVGRLPKGVRAEVERGIIPKALNALHQAGTTVVGVCTGAMLIAAAGLLRGRPAITHHGAIVDLEAAGALIVRARVVDDGRIITSGGVTSGLDLALWLVERYYGPQITHKIETQVEYERRGTVWRQAA